MHLQAIKSKSLTSMISFHETIAQNHTGGTTFLNWMVTCGCNAIQNQVSGDARSFQEDSKEPWVFFASSSLRCVSIHRHVVCVGVIHQHVIGTDVDTGLHHGRCSLEREFANSFGAKVFHKESDSKLLYLHHPQYKSITGLGSVGHAELYIEAK